MQERGGGDSGEASPPPTTPTPTSTSMPSSPRKLLQSLRKLLICVIRGVQPLAGQSGGGPASAFRGWTLVGSLPAAGDCKAPSRNGCRVNASLQSLYFQSRALPFPSTVLGASKSPASWAPYYQRFKLPFMLGCRCLVV